jgi:hypothetical protein
MQISERDLGRDREIASLKNQLKEISAGHADVSKALHRKSKELEDLRNEMTEQINQVEKRREDEIALFRRRTDEAELKMREFETSANSESRRSKYILDQIKDKFGISVQQLETKLDEEKSANKRLLAANRFFINLHAALY